MICKNYFAVFFLTLFVIFPVLSEETPYLNEEEIVLEWVFSVSFPHDLQGRLDRGFKIDNAEEVVKISENTFNAYTSKTFIVNKPVKGYFTGEILKTSGPHVPESWHSGEHDAAPYVDYDNMPPLDETGEVPIIIRMECISAPESSWWPGPQSGTFRIKFIPEDKEAFLSTYKEEQNRGALLRTVAAALAVSLAGGLMTTSCAVQLLAKKIN